MQKTINVTLFDVRFKLKCFRIAFKQFLLYTFLTSIGKTPTDRHIQKSPFNK